MSAATGTVCNVRGVIVRLASGTLCGRHGGGMIIRVNAPRSHPMRRRLSSVARASLLAATVVLSIWTGLAQGWASFGALALWCLAFSGVCVLAFPLWEKAAVGLLMPCWLIFSQFAAVTSCGYGSATLNGRTYVEPTVCEKVSGSSSVTPLLFTLTVLVSIVIVTRHVLAHFWNKTVG